MEILRSHVQLFATASFWLGFNYHSTRDGSFEGATKENTVERLRELLDECKRNNLAMTSGLIEENLLRFENASRETVLLDETMMHICDDLQRELSLQLFVRVSPEHRKRFESPFLGWEQIIKRFGNITRDIEEMNKCFALCRYTAAMFHAMQIAELGAIELGDCIGVTDPKKGWGPTQRKLEQLLKAGRAALPATFTVTFEFLEQMNREIDSMTLAWRHKIDHAANRLAIVPNTDFTPDIAEHIIGAVRVYMMRLMEGMP